jgi:hypothetical protein
VKAVQLIIESTEFNPLINIIKDEFTVEFQSFSKDMIVFVSERFRLRTISSQSEMVILKKEDGKIIVEIIASGGGSGWFNVSWGSEYSFVKKMANKLITYCDKNNISGKKTREF